MTNVTCHENYSISKCYSNNNLYIKDYEDMIGECLVTGVGYLYRSS